MKCEVTTVPLAFANGEWGVAGYIFFKCTAPARMAINP